MSHGKEHFQQVLRKRLQCLSRLRQRLTRCWKLHFRSSEIRTATMLVLTWCFDNVVQLIHYFKFTEALIISDEWKYDFDAVINSIHLNSEVVPQTVPMRCHSCSLSCELIQSEHFTHASIFHRPSPWSSVKKKRFQFTCTRRTRLIYKHRKGVRSVERLDRLKPHVFLSQC